MVFHIGHPSYKGANAPALSLPYLQALKELLSRDVSMIDAQAVLEKARRGSHCTVSTKDGVHVIEVVAAAAG